MYMVVWVAWTGDGQHTTCTAIFHTQHRLKFPFICETVYVKAAIFILFYDMRLPGFKAPPRKKALQWSVALRRPPPAGLRKPLLLLRVAIDKSPRRWAAVGALAHFFGDLVIQKKVPKNTGNK